MMPPDPRQIEEWLSGLLDGVLSEQEQRDLDLAMRNDPSIAQRLEELTNLRRALLQGRPVGRLGSDFSKKILQAARNRASEMDAPPAWILPDAPNAVAPRSEDPLWQEEDVPSGRPALAVEQIGSGIGSKPMVRGIMGSGREQAPVSLADRFLRLWLPSLAVVLALCALVLFLPRRGADDLAGPKPPPKTEPETTIPESNRLEPATPGPSIAKSDDKASSSVVEPMQELPEPNLPDPALPDSNKLAQAPEAMPKEAANPSALDPTKMVMVLVADIAVDAVAQENEMLTQLLDKYEIIASDDAVMEKGDYDRLVDSLMVRVPKPDLNTEEVSLYVVKAGLARLDSFLLDVEKQKADFPSYRLTASLSPVVFSMLKQLDGLSDSHQVAKRLLFTDPISGESSDKAQLPPSKDSDNGAKAIPPNVLKNIKLATSNQAEGYLILMVRKAK
jgi:hypothetical protein